MSKACQWNRVGARIGGFEWGWRLGGVIGVLALLGAATGHAHHSFAMYDQTKTVTITGTVTQFRWTNPHALLTVAIDPAGGSASTNWVLELSSPGNLTRSGWTRASVKVDDKVEVAVYAHRDDTPGGACVKVTIVATGQGLDCLAGDAIRVGEKPNLQ